MIVRKKNFTKKKRKEIYMYTIYIYDKDLSMLGGRLHHFFSPYDPYLFNFNRVSIIIKYISINLSKKKKKIYKAIFF